MRAERAFSLLEVMLATAIFSLTVVGLARGLSSMIGVVGEASQLQKSQRALDSAAMRLLATSNRLSPRESWVPMVGQETNGIVLRQLVRRVEGLLLSPGPELQPAPVLGWVVIRLRADVGADSGKELVFLCNEIR